MSNDEDNSHLDVDVPVDLPMLGISKDGSYPEPMSPVPFRRFDGWLKYQRPDFANELGILVQSSGFPLFASGDKELSEREAARNEALRRRGLTVQELPPVRFRRFAGDMRGVRSLDRSRYYAVCLDEDGHDRDTLANEFNSYGDRTRTGFVAAVDCSALDTPKPAIGIMLEDAPGVPSPLLAAAREKGLLPADASAVRVEIPYAVKRTAIERVLDLRHPDARDWLFREFGAGKPDVLGLRFPAQEGDSFVSMLPSLMIRENGGDDLTNLLGAYLRAMGVEALIFPSARSDVSVTFENGELVDFRGWNLVDYRNASQAPLTARLYWPHPWTGFRDRGNNPLVDITTWIEVAPTDSAYAGSFRVRGNVAHHMLLYHIHFCFAVWERMGFHTPVRAYRWHSTVAKESPRLVYTATCLQCKTSLPELDTIEAFHGIPAECPACGHSGVSLP